jgi:poly-gamma-glutamate synthesis protein (capsule biosynthesis protein)
MGPAFRIPGTFPASESFGISRSRASRPVGGRPYSFAMIRVAAVGDLMLGDSAITVGFGVRSRHPGMLLSEVFGEISPRLKAADLAIGNLECPLIPVGLGGSRWARDQMRGDVAYARVLREAGFTAIAVANNHATQHGEAGFNATVAALRAEGLLVVGLRGSPPWHAEPVRYLHPLGESVALLGYSWRPRQYGEALLPYAEVNPAAVLADIRRARESHDRVLVSLHWGEEFIDQPSVEEVSFARALADQGADLIVGHHPHVVRPVERRGNSTIAYSLGNAVTDMLWMESLRRGLLLELDLSAGPREVRVTPIRVDEQYRVRLGDTSASEPLAPIKPLEVKAYQVAGGARLAEQRVAAYRYAARNVWRYSPMILATLAGTTVRNKLRSLLSRAGVGRA